MDDIESLPKRSAPVYEAFNLDYSVGVACDVRGLIVGVHLGDEVWENSDAWLSTEIVRVARLAHVKSQVGRRAVLTEQGALPHVLDEQGLPTEADYQRMEKAEFGGEF